MKKLILYINLFILLSLLVGCQEREPAEMKENKQEDKAWSSKLTLPQILMLKQKAQGFSAHWLSTQLIVLPKK